MNRAIGTLLFFGLVLSGVQAIADDSIDRSTPTNHQAMKDCIEKQKTAGVSMSKSEMTRICKDQLKQQKQAGIPVDPPPSDTPHN